MPKPPQQAEQGRLQGIVDDASQSGNCNKLGNEYNERHSEWVEIPVLPSAFQFIFPHPVNIVEYKKTAARCLCSFKKIEVVSKMPVKVLQFCLFQ